MNQWTEKECDKSLTPPQPPLVNIVRPSVSSPTGFDMEMEGDSVSKEANGRESFSVAELDEVLIETETDVLLPEKRFNQTPEKLNNKKVGTQSEIELLSFPRDVRLHPFGSLFDVSRRLLRRQEPAYPSGYSPAVSTESLVHRKCLSSTIPRSSDTAITERTRLLQPDKRSSVDTIPNLFINLASGSDVPSRRSHKRSFDSRSAIIRSAGYQSGNGHSFHRCSIPAMSTSGRRSPVNRGFSISDRMPGQPHEATGHRRSEEIGLDTMRKQSNTSVTADGGQKEEGTNQLSATMHTSGNPLFQVSSDMLRITGYTNQFRTLLSKRDEVDGSKSLAVSTSPPIKDGAPGTKQNGGVQFSEVAPAEKDRADKVKRQDTRYGISISSDSAVKQKMKLRKQFYAQRSKLCDLSLIFALIGVALTVIEAELTASAVPGFEKVSR